MIIKTVVDDTGTVVFDAMPPTVATFSKDGWLGSMAAGGSNRVNLNGYSSNLTSAVKNMIQNSIHTNSMLSNITSLMTNVKHDANNLSGSLNLTTDYVIKQDASINNRIDSVINVINRIIGAIINLNGAVNDIINVLTVKNLYPGQTYSDFQLSMLMPVFHLDSFIKSIEQFKSIEKAYEEGNLPNYLLTADLIFQQDFIKYVLAPDFEKFNNPKPTPTPAPTPTPVPTPTPTPVPAGTYPIEDI